jgi:hypothetical protein
VVLLSRAGRAIRFDESDVPTQGRTARGVKGISLKKGGAVVGVLLLRRDAAILTVSEDGNGKRTPASDFPVQKRGGQGTLVGSGGKSPIVAALEVGAEDGVMIISAGGSVHRVAAADIPLQGRRTTGKRVVKVAKGDRVVEVTRAAGAGSEGGGAAGGDPDSPGPAGLAKDDAAPESSTPDEPGVDEPSFDQPPPDEPSLEGPDSDPDDDGPSQLDLLG